MNNSSSMKILPVQNIYQNQNMTNYYNANYQMIHNYQPHKMFQRQKSSSLLQVKNNLLNQIQPIQQQIPQSQQVRIIEIDLKNIQPVMVAVKSSPKIIRIQKKLFKRSTSQKKMQQTNLASDNFNRNLLTNNINYNNQINILSKNIIKSPENFYSNNYEVTSPIKNNNVFSFNNLIPYQNYNYTSSKIENKLQQPTKDINYYTEYKRYKVQDFSNLNNNGNINYKSDIIPSENNEQINAISETKVNTSMNNVTNNYLEYNYNYYDTNNNKYSGNNYTYTNNLYNNNSFNEKYFNTYYNDINNNYIQTDMNNYTNYNNFHSNINNVRSFHSSLNIRSGNQFKKYDNNSYENNGYSNKLIQLKPHTFIRSISSNNLRQNNKGWNNNQKDKNWIIPQRKFQSINDVISGQMINNLDDNKIYNKHLRNLNSYNNVSTVNNNINNNYNINFSININQDYNNTNNKNNINPVNNVLPIVYPELEPSSNFNLSEFIKLGIVGKGTEGIIYAVKWKKNNKKYALKKGIIKLMEVVKKRQEEINMLKAFRLKTGSDGVINIYGYLCLRNKLNSFDFYEIMELAEIDWDKEIERRGKIRQYYSEYELMNIMYQIVQTFSLLQKNHITHRDIKPQNIILVNGKYKIIDFGNARILKRGGLVVQRIRGSEMYMSPAMFKSYHSKMMRIKHNTFKSDVFSLGMCFLLAATLSYTPLNNIREEFNFHIVNKIVRMCIGQRYSEKVYNIILSMLQIEENLRPDFEQLENLFSNLMNIYK